jgi:hypothetical protein
LKEVIEAHTPEEFRKTENREVFARWLVCNTIEELREHLDETLFDHLLYLIEKDLTPADQTSAETAIKQALTRLERRHLQDQQAEILESLNLDPSVAPPRDIEGSIVSVNSRLKQSYLVSTRTNSDH